MPSFNRWLLLLLLIFTGFGGLTAWSFHRAARGASPVTDADYYSHGLRYGQTLLEQKAAATLGWTTQPQLQGRLVSIRLQDSGRAPVTGAAAALTLLGADQGQARELSLREAEPGVYRTELPGTLHGEQPAEVVFRRDGVRLSQRLLLSLK